MKKINMKKINMKKSGFTILELLIVVSILGLLAAFLLPVFQKKESHEKVGEQLVVPTQYGNVSVECIGGYKHTVSESGTKQLLNERGGGVACR